MITFITEYSPNMKPSQSFPTICLRATSENEETKSTVKLVHHLSLLRPQLLHITTVGFDKANARMNPPAN